MKLSCFLSVFKIILFFLLLGFTKVDAQIHEIGLFLGGSNYIGDVGPTTYIAPDEFAYGICGATSG